MAITGIGHLALVVSDMKKSTEFYSGILGFEKVFDIPDAKGAPWIVYFKIGAGQFIELFYQNKEAPVDVAAKGAFSHVCYLVDDIHRTETDIKKRGGVLDRPIKLGVDGNYQCWIKDPDGNRIEFMQIMPGSPHARVTG
jgi:lactoylglutathione lyase